MREHESQKSRWLRWAQIAWVVLVAAALLMYVAGSAVYYGQLRQVCAAAVEQCAEYSYATPTGAAQLAARGLSLDTYALLRAGFRVLLGLVPITLELLIFARKRSEPIALLISLFLVTFGMAGEAVSVLAAAYPVFRIPAVMLDFIAAGIMMLLFFGLFPNGRMAPRRYWVVVAYFGIGYFVQATLGLVDIASPLGSFWP